MLVTKDILKNTSDLVIRRVDLPELGDGAYLFVRTISALDRERYEESVVKTEGRNVQIKRQNMRVKLVILSACDEEGNRLFDSGDVGLLANKSAVVINKIFEAAQEVNGMTGEDKEEIEENF